MARLALPPLVLFVLAGCASARPAPRATAPVAATATLFALPVAAHSERRDALPLSIQRLVSEERSEMQDVATLAAPVGDERGRARAAREVTALADELRGIEAGLRARVSELDSERLDEIVVQLQRLSTRIAILHDALRVASGPPTAVEVDQN